MYLWSFGKKLVRICLCVTYSLMCASMGYMFGGKVIGSELSPQNSRLLPLPPPAFTYTWTASHVTLQVRNLE